MARARTLKPSFFTNEHLGKLPLGARVVFQGLWCHADREGRLEDRPTRLKVEILPYDKIDMGAMLARLEEAGFIVRYEAENRRIIQIVNFTKHQRPHPNETASVLPIQEMSGNVTSTREKVDSAQAGSSFTLDLDPGVPPSAGAAPPPPPLERFYQANRNDQRVGALIDAAKAVGRTVNGGRIGAMLAKHTPTEVAEAFGIAVTRNAAGIEDYMQGVLNGRTESAGRRSPRSGAKPSWDDAAYERAEAYARGETDSVS